MFENSKTAQHDSILFFQPYYVEYRDAENIFHVLACIFCPDLTDPIF